MKRSCGSPSLIPSDNSIADEMKKPHSLTATKWISPPDAEMLFFLVNVEKSKDLYSKIVDGYVLVFILRYLSKIVQI